MYGTTETQLIGPLTKSQNGLVRVLPRDEIIAMDTHFLATAYAESNSFAIEHWTMEMLWDLEALRRRELGASA